MSLPSVVNRNGLRDAPHWRLAETMTIVLTAIEAVRCAAMCIRLLRRGHLRSVPQDAALGADDGLNMSPALTKADQAIESFVSALTASVVGAKGCRPDTNHTMVGSSEVLLDVLDGKIKYNLSASINDMEKLLSTFCSNVTCQRRMKQQLLQPLCSHAEEETWINGPAVWLLLLCRHYYIKSLEFAVDELQNPVKVQDLLDRNRALVDRSVLLVKVVTGISAVPNRLCSVLRARFDGQESLFQEYQHKCRRLQWSSYRAILRHLYFGSGAKILSVGITTVLSLVSSRLMLTGMWLRHEGERLVHRGVGKVGFDANFLVLGGALMAAETVRFALSCIAVRCSDAYVTAVTTQRRETQKLELYRCLVRHPLSFFDLYSYDDIEEMVLYVNDLEGVDVHLQHYWMQVQQSLVNAIHVATLVSRETLILALCGVSLQKAVLAVTVMLANRWDRFALWIASSVQQVDEDSNISSAFDNISFDDLEELENQVSGDAEAGNGVLLRGLEIIGYIHSLRPYGADRRLMEWWCAEMERLVAQATSSGLRKLLRPVLGWRRWQHGEFSNDSVRNRVLLALGKSVLVLERVHSSSVCIVRSLLQGFSATVQWLVPVVVAAVTAQQSIAVDAANDYRSTRSEASLAVDALHCALELFNVAADSKRILELLYYNGFKALSLQRIADPSSLEMPLIEEANSNGHREVDEIDINELTFSYPFKERSTLNALTMRTGSLRGRFVCISGANGCGKSTLLKLLMRLYSPKGLESGTIKLLHPDGGSYCGASSESCSSSLLSDVSPTIVRQDVFCFVPQQPFVLHGTIAQNVSLEQRVSVLDTDVLETVERALQLSQAIEFVRDLPEGMMTLIAPQGEGGCSSAYIVLSGGQAQRLMIARALYSAMKSSLGGAKILLMDEPTASLDNDTKLHLLRSLRGLLQDPTSCVKSLIVVSHDADVKALCDLVIDIGESQASPA